MLCLYFWALIGILYVPASALSLCSAYIHGAVCRPNMAVLEHRVRILFRGEFPYSEKRSCHVEGRTVRIRRLGENFKSCGSGSIRPTRQAIQLAIHLIDTPVMKLSAVPLRSVKYDIFSDIKLLYYFKLKA